MKSDDEIAAEVAAHEDKHGEDFKQDIVSSQYPEEYKTEEEKARFYCLVHACRYGLGWECLKWFYEFQETDSSEPWKNANDALSEWDV